MGRPNLAPLLLCLVLGPSAGSAFRIATDRLDANDSLTGRPSFDSRQLENAPRLNGFFSSYVPASDYISNGLCRNHSRIFLKELDRFTLWAVAMFDASVKIPEGVLAGTTYQLGNFDECIKVDVPLEGEARPLRGKYCLATVRLSLPEELFNRTPSPGVPYHRLDLKLSAWEKLRIVTDRAQMRRDITHWAFCIPSSCTAKDLEESLKEYLEKSKEVFGLELKAEVEEGMCQTKNTKPFNYAEIAVSVTIGVFVCLVVAGTLCDVYVVSPRTKKINDSTYSNKLEECLVCFSMYRNIRNLGKHEESQGEVLAMHGVRVYSMFLIIFGHRCMFMFGGPLYNTEFPEQLYFYVRNMFLLNGPIIVDTFFMLGGLLYCYLFLIELDKRKRINILNLYICRYIRLTPVYLMVVAFYATLLYRLDSGPLWESKIGVERDRCSENWWANMLYINNYYKTDRMCMFQSWYISSDMHYFLIAPMVVYPLWRWPSWGKLLLFASIFVSIAIPFAATYFNHLEPVLLLFISMLRDPVASESFNSVYIKTHIRGGPYFYGLFVGYIVYKIKKTDVQISKVWVAILWFLAPLSSLAAMFLAWMWYIPDRPYNALEAAFYAGLHRIGWCAGISWGILAVLTGNGGFFRPFFCWKALIPLSRLTYCAFLAHGGVQLYTNASSRTPNTAGFFNLFWNTSGDIVLTFVIALVLCLMFESPVRGLEKAFLRNGRRRPEQKKEVDEEQPENNNVNLASRTRTVNSVYPDDTLNRLFLNKFKHFSPYNQQEKF